MTDTLPGCQESRVIVRKMKRNLVCVIHVVVLGFFFSLGMKCSSVNPGSELFQDFCYLVPFSSIPNDILVTSFFLLWVCALILVLFSQLGRIILLKLEM